MRSHIHKLNLNNTRYCIYLGSHTIQLYRWFCVLEFCTLAIIKIWYNVIVISRFMTLINLVLRFLAFTHTTRKAV